MMNALFQLLTSKESLAVYERIQLICGYLLSLSLLVIGSLVLISGGGILGLNALAAGIIFLPNREIPSFIRLLLGTILVVFLL